MHKTQERLLKLANKIDIGTVSKRQLGRLIGNVHPQTIIYHLKKLEDLGFIQGNIKNGSIQPIKTVESQLSGSNMLSSIPIVGAANCGTASAVADEHIENFLKLSAGILKNIKPDGLCAVKAIGDSLNRAKNITDGPIEEGDFVLVDTTNRNPRNGEYVLSVIDGLANMKRFFKDTSTGQVVLTSESAEDIPPIYIAEEDANSYMINGIIKKVVKQPNFQ